MRLKPFEEVLRDLYCLGLPSLIERTSDMIYFGQRVESSFEDSWDWFTLRFAQFFSTSKGEIHMIGVVFFINVVEFIHEFVSYNIIVW